MSLRCQSVLALLVLGVGLAAQPSLADGAGQALLERAFANRYELDLTQRVEIAIRDRSGGSRRRVLEMARKRIEGRICTFGRFVEPKHLRGTAILTIENDARDDDHFLYLPSHSRVRRVSSAQRADAFMGSDLSYEDMEQRRADDYRAWLRGRGEVEGEPVFIVGARPDYASGYAALDFHVAQRDHAILEIHYFKTEGAPAHKVLRAPRSRMQQAGGHVLPGALIVENRERRTRTEVRIDRLVVNPKLRDELFTAAALEQRRPIPGF